MARSSVLAIARSFAGSKGIAQPASLQGSNDAQVIQMLSLMNELPDDLMARKKWQVNRFQLQFASLAQEDQGTLDSLTGEIGFLALVPDTMWDLSVTLPIKGAMNPDEYAAYKAQVRSDPWPRYILMQDHLLIWPAPAAGHQIGVFVQTEWFARSSAGVPQQYFVKDTDTLCFPDAVARQWLNWKWKEAKGLDYAESFRLYEAALASISLTEAAPRTAYSTRGARGYPGPFGYSIPIGNWPLTNGP